MPNNEIVGRSIGSGGGGGSDKNILYAYELPPSHLLQPETADWQNDASYFKTVRNAAIVQYDDNKYFLMGGRTTINYKDQASFNVLNYSSDFYRVGNDKCYLFDSLTNTLTEFGTLPQYSTDSSSGTGAASSTFIDEPCVGAYEGKIYWCGGWCAAYDAANGYTAGTRYGSFVRGNRWVYRLDLNAEEPAWEALSNLEARIPPKHGVNCCVYEDKLYMFGGMKLYSIYDNGNYFGNWYRNNDANSWWNSDISTALEDYHPENKDPSSHVLYMKTGALEQIPDIPDEVGGQYGASIEMNGKIYIINRTTFYVFDPVKLTYTKLANPTEVDDRRFLAKISDQNQIITYGGSTTLPEVFVYSVDTDTWASASYASNIIYGAASYQTANIIYRFGGTRGGVSETTATLNTSNAIDSYGLNSETAAELGAVVVKIPKGYWYHSNRPFWVGEKFQITTQPQLASEALEIKVGEYNAGHNDQTMVYVQKD